MQMTDCSPYSKPNHRSRSSVASEAENICTKPSCCSSQNPPDKSANSPSLVMTPMSNAVDIEKGNGITERVFLSVQGLTCIGCENKLFRSLDSIPAVANLQTSLVLSRAEFDLDLGAHTVSEVIRFIEKSTGFACEQIRTTGQCLDILVSENVKEFVQEIFPTGVTDMSVLDKELVRVTYDPDVIGARDLLESGFKSSVLLAPSKGDPALTAGKKHVYETAYMTLASALLTIPVLIFAWAPLPRHKIPYGAVSLALATIVQCVIAGPFYPSALRALVYTRMIEMDLLIVLSTTTAYVFSVVAFAYQVRGRPLLTGGFFETSTLLVTLIMLGRLMSAIARQKAVESISIRSLQCTTALLVDLVNNKDREIDARLLQYGDSFKVMPESLFPTDGVITSGTTEVDESMVTGEALPVHKQPGSAVLAGSVNGSGIVIVELTHLAGTNTISEIASMVDDAKFTKPKAQELADRVAGYFVPVVVGLTIITFAVWIAVDIGIRRATPASAVVQAITYAISVLIVSCPCAIGLAVPMVVVIAGGVAAKRGVIFKSAEIIETARKVTHVVFDKTGTLTRGQLSVRVEEYVCDNRETIASVTLGLTSDIKHPVASAVSKHLKALETLATSVADIKTITGCGVEGTWDGKSIKAGNSKWLGFDQSPIVRSVVSQGLTAFCVCSDSTLLAIFGLADSIRPDAHCTISELRRREIAISILSGDDDGAVQSIAAQLDIPSEFVRSKCTPSEKQQYIKNLLDNEEIVLFCGDGTNDALALAQATIGVHMNEGTDMAQSAADAILMRPYLSGILTLIELSKAAYRRIMFNFAWATVYNVFAILLAAGAFVNARIPPQYAGLGEIVSVLPVILVALQLKWA